MCVWKTAGQLQMLTPGIGNLSAVTNLREKQNWFTIHTIVKDEPLKWHKCIIHCTSQPCTKPHLKMNVLLYTYIIVGHCLPPSCTWITLRYECAAVKDSCLWIEPVQRAFDGSFLYKHMNWIRNIYDCNN